jgi:uracil-DNA glycosylase
MSVDRSDLGRYLRQLADLGVHELYLDSLTAGEAMALAAAAGAAGADAAASIAAGHGNRAAPATVAAPAGSTAGAPAAVAASAAAPSLRVREAAPAATATTVAASGLAPVAASAAPPPSMIAAAGAARTAAADGSALALLATRAAGCTLCRLHEQRTNVVFGEGDPDADVVIVGEAPGQEEDRTGRPFVGRAGRLLDLLLMTIGRPRSSVYICNVLKCRPPNNRNPMADEVAACTGSLLHGQLEAIAPKVLLAVGKFAAQSLLQSEESIGRLRGVVHEYRGRPLVVTYHPAYLLRSPQMTRVAWQDFQLLRKVLDEQA